MLSSTENRTAAEDAAARHAAVAPSRRPPAAMRRRGASLVEILVVLVILLIGVFLAIRIFPTGFGTLRANENRTTATRLAQRLLALAKGDAAENLPLAVLSAVRNPDTGVLFVNTEQDPNDLSPIQQGRSNPYFDDMNRFRFVKGEQVKVPLATVSGEAIGSLYTVKFGPILMDGRVGVRNAVATGPDQQTLFDSYLLIYGAPLAPIPQETTNQNALQSLRGPQSFLVDYGGDEDSDPAAILLSPREPASPARAIPNRTFRVSFSYVDGDGNVRTELERPLIVPDAAAPAWLTLTAGGTTLTNGTPVQDVIPGSVTVVRVFDRIRNNPDDLTDSPFDPQDPYQYKLASDNIPDTFANIGAIIFNPTGGNYAEQTPYGTRPFTAFIDYAVLDWHIIRDDVEVPHLSLGDSRAVPIRTALAPIKQSGDPEGDLATYNNIFGDPNPANQSDIIVYNLADPSGRPLAQGTYTPAQVNAGGFDYYVDPNPRGGTYRTGTIYINTSPGRVPRGAILRVLYRAQGDWGVALQKANAQYRCSLVRSTADRSVLIPQPVPGINQFQEFGIQGGGATARVVFPLSDLDKSVSLAVEYQNGANPRIGAEDEWVRLDPIQVTLTDIETSGGRRFAVANLNPGDGGKRYIPESRNQDFNNARQWRVSGPGGLGIAYGTSVKARVIWKDPDAANNRWRVQDLDSNLTPSP